jgi:hypothetical protein
MGLAVVGNLHARGSLALEDQPGDQCVSENAEIRPVHKREGIRTEHGQAFSIANSQIEDSRAAITLHHATVVTLESRNPD